MKNKTGLIINNKKPLRFIKSKRETIVNNEQKN